MIGGYDIRVVFKIFRLRRREEVYLAATFACKEKLRTTSTRFGQEQLCEILTVDHGGPELAYAMASRYGLRRQPREYLCNDLNRKRQGVTIKRGR